MRLLLVTCLLTCAALGCVGRRGARVDAQADGRVRDLARAENDGLFALFEAGKHARAEELLKRVVAADVMFGPARNNLGVVYYHTNRLYLAACEFEIASRLMPHLPEPRNNLGLVLE